MYRTFSSWLTARHRYFRFPLIVRNTSSRCHLSPGRGQLFWHHCRIASLPTMTSRASIISFDLTETEREPLVQPHTVADDLPRVSMALVQRRRRGTHRRSPPPKTYREPHPTTPQQLPVPYQAWWSGRRVLGETRNDRPTICEVHEDGLTDRQPPTRYAVMCTRCSWNSWNVLVADTHQCTPPRGSQSFPDHWVTGLEQPLVVSVGLIGRPIKGG